MDEEGNGHAGRVDGHTVRGTHERGDGYRADTSYQTTFQAAPKIKHKDMKAEFTEIKLITVP